MGSLILARCLLAACAGAMAALAVIAPALGDAPPTPQPGEWSTPAPVGIGGPVGGVIAQPAPTPVPTLDLPIIPYPTPSPGPTPAPGPGPLPNPIQIIQNWINARIWFPAETFIQAITEAAEAIFTAQLEAIKEPMKAVVGFILFGGVAIFGNAALPEQVARLGEILVAAAVPLWVLSLATMGLSVLARNATNMGYATNDAASEGVRWALICLASGNGLVIVNLVHSGFNALNGAIASIGGASAEAIVDLLLPATLLGGVPLLVLILGILIAFFTMLILTVTYAARYVMLLAIAGLAPLAIATEGLPFARIVFRDWVGMFLKVELLGVLNTFILVLIAVVAEAAAGARGLEGTIAALVSIILMVGLSSAVIGVNLSVFHDVFGVAVGMANQALSALAFAVSFLATGGAGALASAEPAVATAAAGQLTAGLGRALDSPVLGAAGRGITGGAISQVSEQAAEDRAQRLSDAGDASAARGQPRPRRRGPRGRARGGPAALRWAARRRGDGAEHGRALRG